MNEKLLNDLVMVEYIKNNYSIEVKDFSIYYDRHNNYYSFDFFIDDVYYAYYDDGIQIVDFKRPKGTSASITLDCNGIDNDEFFNVSLIFNVCILVKKEISMDLIAKAKELGNNKTYSIGK